MPIQRAPRVVFLRSVATIVQTSRMDATAATARWLYSMRTSVRSGGMNRPWQSGQSGHASPEPVALTTFPTVMSRNTAATAAQPSALGTGCPLPPRRAVGARLATMAHLGRGERHVVCSRRLPAEEDHREGEEKDEPAGDPHDEPAEVLVGARGHPGPEAW